MTWLSGEMIDEDLCESDSFMSPDINAQMNQYLSMELSQAIKLHIDQSMFDEEEMLRGALL